MTAPWEGRPVVYRCMSVDGECLYVGQTIALDARIKRHTLTQPWGPDIGRVRVTLHRDKATARTVEAEEIRRLRPHWNINGRGDRTAWSPCDYTEVIQAVRVRREFAWIPESCDQRVELLIAELRRRFPDVADQILAHIPGEAAA